ncbi:dipeptide ABC transporter ATP-binding protein [Paracoccus sp. Z118]|uniref:dipeptide ABC transporter ATP-binding protein n=1 Tax=Paracoccus sp. Z118 TaxID=2851017 RepID=UPI001C2BBF32|nr:dipeptide ABC transporter ATP-binding protein [Paracoccus sp. Z118]MBV0891295.1 dipeptide ABC transporter ATP-binding protein [Paracoccus sp. Z118]
MIRVKSLSASIGTRPVLEEVTLDLPPGQVTGLVGQSGSGKSMTALAIMGLLPDAARVSGAVELDGQNLLALTERQMTKLRGRRIGMIFQEPMTALNPLMTIGDQVAEVLTLHGMTREAARAIARERLDRVGLTAPRFPLTAYPHELSGGQRQRVAIAMAIAAAPVLLIADEPTTALDVTTQAQILNLLRGLVRDEGMALLLISHDLAMMAGIADRVAVMYQGRIVEQGRARDLFRDHRHPHTRALFAASRHQPAGAPPREAQETRPILRAEGAVREYRLPRPAPFAPHPMLRAVDGAHLSIAPGESVGLVGESGCGKSTLTRAILGLEPLQGGRILLDGEPVTDRMPHALRAKVQVVFQDPFGSFDPRWRVDRLVAEPFHLTGRPRDWRDRVAQALAEVDLPPDAMRRHIHEFSGGQRQRIAIARALIIRPRLIVLDEAVSALDVQVRAQVLDLLASLRASHRMAWLFISHDLSVVRSITHRVLVMERGRIVEDGATAQVLTDPQSEAARRLVAATPRIPAEWVAETGTVTA